MKKLTVIAVSLVLLIACSKKSGNLKISGPPEIPTTQNSQTTRPFTATLNAAVDVNSTNPPTACSGNIPFAAPDFILNGIATHLGQINPQTSRLHHISCNLSVATMLLTTSVGVDIVSANGDIIHCTGNDVVNVANLLTATGTTGTITGTWTITGGTGRFNGASGSFTISGLVDFVANSFSCECTGTISY